MCIFGQGCGHRTDEQRYFSLRMDECGDIVVAICDWTRLAGNLKKKRERERKGRKTLKEKVHADRRLK